MRLKSPEKLYYEQARMPSDDSVQTYDLGNSALKTSPGLMERKCAQAITGALQSHDYDLLETVLRQAEAMPVPQKSIRSILRQNRYQIFRQAVESKDEKFIQTIFNLALKYMTDAGLKQMLTCKYAIIGAHFKALLESGQFETAEWITGQLKEAKKTLAQEACAAIEPENQDYLSAILHELSKNGFRKSAKILKPYNALLLANETDLRRKNGIFQDLLLHAAGQKDPQAAFPEIFTFIKNKIGKKAAWQILEVTAPLIASHIQTSQAAQQIFGFLASQNRQDIALGILSTNNFALYRRSCKESESLMKRLVFLAKELGGSNLVDRMIAVKNHIGLRYAVSQSDKLKALLIVNALDDEERKSAIKHVPKSWEIFHLGRKIKTDEIWQDIGGANERWRAVTNSDAPHPDLAKQSPYKFKVKLYEQILQQVRAACAFKGQDSQAELAAYKLAVLFPNAQEVDRYLNYYAKQWKKETATASTIIEATCFQIPEKGLWNVEYWRNLIIKHGSKAAETLKDAPEIEALARKLDKALPKTLNALRALILEGQHSRLGIRQDFAAAAAANGIGSGSYKEALAYLKKHGAVSDFMPDVFIDGSSISLANYYFMKLDGQDPMQCLLGEINNHSLSYSNPAGQYTVPHVVSSKYSGAYVMKKKTGGKITPTDDIIADSWAYLTEQNNIVFDGIGAKESSTRSDGPISNIDRKFRTFLEQFAFEVVDKHSFPATSEHMRPNVETTHPDRVRNDADCVFVEGVRLGDDKEWMSELSKEHKQLSADSFGQLFIPQDKKQGWIHNESQENQLIIPPVSHRKSDSIEVGNPDTSYAALLEAEAKAYIKRTVDKLKAEYGITLQIGLELEMFAFDMRGKRSSSVLNLASVNHSLAASGLDAQFEHENTDDEDGQYEAITKPHDPLAAADMATNIRDHLIKYAASFGLSRFAFDSTLEKDAKNEAPIEPSSTHINYTVWSRNGRPLTTKEGEAFSAVTHLVTKGMLEVQKKLSVLFAQSAQDFKRYGYMSPAKKRKDPHKIYAPTHIFAIQDDHERIYEGPTFAIWHSSKTIAPRHSNVVRLENRMAGSNINYYVAIAGTVASIEWAFANYTRVLTPAAKASDFPQNEYEILDIDGIKLAIHKDFTLPDKKYTGWHGPGYSHRKKSYMGKYPQDVFPLPHNRTEALHSLAAPGNRAFAQKILGQSFYQALISYQVPASLRESFGFSTKGFVQPLSAAVEQDNTRCIPEQKMQIIGRSL